MKEILGKKIGMTRVFNAAGDAVPVTVIECGPCPVIGKLTIEKNGYEAYRVGFGLKRKKLVSKPNAGQFKHMQIDPTRHIREIRIDGGQFEVGANVTVDIFKEGEKVDVTAVSRGLGFAGVMKLHNFGGGPVTHGQSDRMRAPGSIGQSSFPSRVFKGMKMAGRMGRNTVTTLNLPIVKIIGSENLILVRGAVPGHRGALVKIRSTNRGKGSIR